MTADSSSFERMSQNLPDEILSGVLEKLTEITRAANNGDFVFRGEPKHYDEISSGLYREYKERLGPFGLQGFDLRHVQDEIIEEAASYARGLEPHDLLSQLQHYGHLTNLIDFTSDYLIALYFACASEVQEDGRIILLESANAPLYRMHTPENRIKAQKSVFVNPKAGTISPDLTISIPSDLKLGILEFLMRNHDISARTIYDDIHGFIRNASIHRSAYAEFHIGRLYFLQGNPQEALKHFDRSVALNGAQKSTYANRGSVLLFLERIEEAISDFTRAIELDPTDPHIFLRRGLARETIGQPGLAEKDFSEAIRLDEKLVDAYEQRALTRVLLQDLEGAIEDLNIVLGLGPQRGTAFNSRGLAYWMIGEDQAAEADFNKAIELDRNYATPYVNRANFKLELGRFQEAIEDYDTYMLLDGDNLANVLFKEAIAYLALGNFAEARKSFQRSLEIEPDVACEVFETEERVSEFLQNVNLTNQIPDDLLEMLKPKRLI